MMRQAQSFADSTHPGELSELLKRYLQRQASAHEEGFGTPALQREVEPYDAIPAQPVDGRLAWDEAWDVLRYYTNSPTEQTAQRFLVPPDWPMLVSAQDSVFALPYCLGNFPQMVRSLPWPLAAPDLTSLRGSGGGSPLGSSSVSEWVNQMAERQQYPQHLLAIGILRLAKHFDLAEKLLRQKRAQVPSTWLAAWSHEEAALLWHQGRFDEASQLWQSQAHTTPVLFNRGMAALFANQRSEARVWLSQAVVQIPEDNAWHHLGQFYLALAEIDA